LQRIFNLLTNTFLKMKKVFLFAAVAAIGLGSCNKSEEATNNSHNVQKISPNEINVGVLHNQGLDILLEAITPLYLNKDSVFANYMQVLAEKMDELTALYDGNVYDFPQLKEIYSNLKSAGEVETYIEEMQNDLILNAGLVGKMYNELITNLNELSKNPLFYSDGVYNQVEIIDNMCQEIREKYLSECKTELEKFSLKTMTEICLYSFIYWADDVNMERWEEAVKYAKKDKKEKKEKKDKSKWEKVGEFVAADVGGGLAGGAAGSVIPGVGTAAGAIAGGSCASGATALSW